MEACATRYGSVIEEVSGTGIETLISAEKLRGTDLCLGPTGARMRRQTPVLVENSLYRLSFRRSGVSLWGPHAVHGWI